MRSVSISPEITNPLESESETCDCRSSLYHYRHTAQLEPDSSSCRSLYHLQRYEQQVCLTVTSISTSTSRTTERRRIHTATPPTFMPEYAPGSARVRSSTGCGSTSSSSGRGSGSYSSSRSSGSSNNDSDATSDDGVSFVDSEVINIKHFQVHNSNICRGSRKSSSTNKGHSISSSSSSTRSISNGSCSKSYNIGSNISIDKSYNSSSSSNSSCSSVGWNSTTSGEYFINLSETESSSTTQCVGSGTSCQRRSQSRSTRCSSSHRVTRTPSQQSDISVGVDTVSRSTRCSSSHRVTRTPSQQSDISVGVDTVSRSTRCSSSHRVTRTPSQQSNISVGVDTVSSLRQLYPTPVRSCQLNHRSQLSETESFEKRSLSLCDTAVLRTSSRSRSLGISWSPPQSSRYPPVGKDAETGTQTSLAGPAVPRPVTVTTSDQSRDVIDTTQIGSSSCAQRLTRFAKDSWSNQTLGSRLCAKSCQPLTVHFDPRITSVQIFFTPRESSITASISISITMRQSGSEAHAVITFTVVSHRGTLTGPEGYDFHRKRQRWDPVCYQLQLEPIQSITHDGVDRPIGMNHISTAPLSLPS
ncbi:hypothetical protein EGW08_022433 [Elysia chlorotica]|uniref:Uncharacterized protein n=1 Tax=Elysia chlorotica TaxID=188477 RepID=A0A3S1BLD3_ELYCH|nr:hypothetical protein EGW08_022433 [Elysia chlorotica]